MWGHDAVDDAGVDITVVGGANKDMVPKETLEA